MNSDILSPQAQREVQQALLHGEEVRYVTCPGISFSSVLLHHCRKSLIFCVGLHAIILAYAAPAIRDVWMGTQPVSYLVLMYAVLLIFVLVGRASYEVSFGVARDVVRSVYLVTTHRVMILRPGNMILSRPLEAELIDHIEYLSDGWGYMYFKPVGKFENPLQSGCFACIPEVHQVETLIDELTASVLPLPDCEAPEFDANTLKSDNCKRLVKGLNPGERVLWMGRSLPLSRAQQHRERREFWLWTCVALSGCACSCISAADNAGMWLLAVLYLAVAVFFLLMLLGHDDSLYAITNMRVCCIMQTEIMSFPRDVAFITQFSNGVINVGLKSDGNKQPGIQGISSLLPVHILLRQQLMAK